MKGNKKFLELHKESKLRCDAKTKQILGICHVKSGQIPEFVGIIFIT